MLKACCECMQVIRGYIHRGSMGSKKTIRSSSSIGSSVCIRRSSNNNAWLHLFLMSM